MFTGSLAQVCNMSVFVACAVALSVSSALSLHNMRGDDLSNFGLVHEFGEWRRFELVLLRISSRRPKRRMPGIHCYAARIRDLVGMPSLGQDAFASRNWTMDFASFGDALEGNNAWARSWPNTIPYPVDPLSMLWLCDDYFALWGIPRSPVTFTIEREKMFNLARAEHLFNPAAGDDVI